MFNSSECASGLLSCFAVVVRGIYGKVDIYQTVYSIHSKLKIFPYSKVIHGSTIFKLTKGQQKLKNKLNFIILLNVMFLFFHLLLSNIPDNNCHKQKWRVLFLTRIKLVARVLACAFAISCIKWRRLNTRPVFESIS